jgi:hypothetical protein
MGGKYADDDKPKNLKKWFKSKWIDVGNGPYPVYRPTVKASKALTVSEIDPKNLKEQIKLKQLIRGEHNLPPFKRK